MRSPLIFSLCPKMVTSIEVSIKTCSRFTEETLVLKEIAWIWNSSLFINFSARFSHCSRRSPFLWDAAAAWNLAHVMFVFELRNLQALKHAVSVARQRAITNRWQLSVFVMLPRFESYFRREAFKVIFPSVSIVQCERESAQSLSLLQLEQSCWMVFAHSLLRRCTAPFADLICDISCSNKVTTCFEATRVNWRSKEIQHRYFKLKHFRR